MWRRWSALGFHGEEEEDIAPPPHPPLSLSLFLQGSVRLWISIDRFGPADCVCDKRSVAFVMTRKRKTEEVAPMDEADRTIYSTFCGAANSLSQLYTQAMHQQTLSFDAGECHALVHPPVPPFLFSCIVIIWFLP
ncbi:hypothetical protein BHM03_00060040 [Ensete ventricosum]|nr:hypothetical protein BHM03_00060040 [Ensete ventricosum]